jgi:hypothetical protein
MGAGSRGPKRPRRPIGASPGDRTRRHFDVERGLARGGGRRIDAKQRARDTAAHGQDRAQEEPLAKFDAAQQQSQRLDAKGRSSGRI